MNQSLKIVVWVIAVSLIFAISDPVAVFSEPGSADTDDNVHKLETVVVTATKNEDEIRHVAASVTVIDEKDIQASGARVLTDVIHRVAGLQMNEWEGSGEFSMVSMRGMPMLNSQYVQVLVDGIPRNTPQDNVDWSAISLESVERIEILKGPASAIYGKNAIGGVINIITRKGGDTHKQTLTGGFGSYGENRETALLSGPLSKMNYSMGITRREGDGWRDENNHFERYNGFVRLDGSLSERTAFSLSADYSSWNLEYPDYLPIALYDAGERETVFFKHGKEKHSEPNVALTINHDMGNGLRLVNKAYGQWIDEEWRDIVDVVDKDLDTERLGDELRLISDHTLFDRKNRINLGYHFENEDYEEVRRFSRYHPNPARRGQTNRNADALRRFHAFYVQDELECIPDTVTLTAGIRYDRVSVDLDNLLDPSASRDTTFDHFSPKAGIAFTPIPSVSFFVNLGSGFKAPVGSQIATNPEINPEKAISYEAGVKADLFDRAYVRLTAYRTDLDDQLVMVPDIGGDGTFHYENAGKSRMQGLEFEADITLGMGFSLFTSYTFNRSYYIDFIDYSMDYSDNDLPWQPEHKIVAELRYKHDSGFGASLSDRWVSEQWIDNENDFEQGAYNLVDMKLTYIRGMFEAKLAVRNVFDTDYAAAGENWGDGDAYLTPGDPRTFFAELSLHF